MILNCTKIAPPIAPIFLGKKTMATYTKIASGWRAQIRKSGISKSKNFRTKAEAQAWAMDIEKQIVEGEFGKIPDITFAELVDKYIREISIQKRGYRSEKLRLLRLSKVSNASVLREWSTLSNLLNIAVEEWKFLKVNYLKNLKKPQQPAERTRRYSEQEIERLLFVSGYDFEHIPLTVQNRTGAAMLFAIETAMRAGEICKAKWSDLKSEGKILHIPITKNGHPRDIPLSTFARKIINHLGLIKNENDDRIFQIDSASLDATFRTLKDRAGLANADLHFHDTRREALSRMSKKVEVMTLAKISGHRDLKILLNTYYAPNIEEVVDLLG